MKLKVLAFFSGVTALQHSLLCSSAASKGKEASWQGKNTFE
jgi:hypothetical protein